MSDNKVIPFNKVLAKYYETWYRDCHDSVGYCLEHGYETKAAEYARKAIEYFDIINDHWYEIEFFSVGHNAHLIESVTQQRFNQFLEEYK